MSSYVVVSWDTETTGLKRDDQIISLGAVATIYEQSKNLSEFGKLTQKVIGEFHEFIHTDLPITSEHIHHISAQVLKDANAQPFAVVLQQWQTWLRSFNKPIILIAHNGRAFDEKILYCNMINHDPPIPFVEWMKQSRVHGFLDSLVLFKTKQKQIKDLVVHPVTKVPSLTLNIIHLSWCGFEMPGHHNALADAQALCRILNTPLFKTHFKLNDLIQKVSIVQKTWQALTQQTGIETKRKLDECEAESNKRQKTMKFEPISDYVGDDSWKCCTRCITFCDILENHECVTT